MNTITISFPIFHLTSSVVVVASSLLWGRALVLNRCRCVQLKFEKRRIRYRIFELNFQTAKVMKESELLRFPEREDKK